MVKRGKFFSILAVLTLLILLAPAGILAPVGNVAAADSVITVGIAATLTFNEDSQGDWWTFTAGSGGIQSPGLTLEQYTRPYVLRGTTLAGCTFRNYTTGAGNVVGGLIGTMDLAWNTFNFNQKYPNATALYYNYGTGAHFGWMAGRGHFYATNTSDNFTFVFVLDVDSSDANMTNATGKGFMVSVEENGTFGKTNMTDNDTHQIIGSFNVSKTGTAYTWNLQLRNYPPNEVYYKGDVTVAGYVMQELTDPIHAPVALVNFTRDGGEVTPVDAPTGLEEIAWGKDPIKNVTGGPLGPNGVMDITRNGALYLTTPEGEVHIQAAEACILHINDTYAQTGDDNSTYGHTYYYLLLSLPYQELPIGDMFNQTGYTFYPFGMYLDPTEWYAGAETFAIAHIEIMSAIGNAYQTSIDNSYGLYPHPQVENIFPSAGVAGTTMKVKIAGKYFLRAAGEKSGWVANSGSVSFGPNVTVINYTIIRTPFDDSIIANITIAAGASGARDVTVTSCFGYNGTGAGNGTDPYESGVKADGFTIVGTGATLDGRATFARKWPSPNSTWITPLNVSLFQAGNRDFEVLYSNTTNNTGGFVLSGLAPGTYDIGIKNWTCLSNVSTSVTLTDNATTVVNFGTIAAKILEGDCNHAGAGTDRVGFDDYIDVLVNYGKAYWKADFDRTGLVGFDDYITVLVNYGKQGDMYK